MMPRIEHHAGYWWEEIAVLKTKQAAEHEVERIWAHFADAPRPHRVAMSSFVCPNCGEREFAVWLELRPMELARNGVPHFVN